MNDISLSIVHNRSRQEIIMTDSSADQGSFASEGSAQGPFGSSDENTRSSRRGGFGAPVSYTHLTLPTNREV